MRKFPRQAEAVSNIERLLKSRKLDIQLGIVLIGEDEPWQVFEHEGKCLAVNPNGGIWIGSSGQDWKCLSNSCTVSDALEAIEFLIQTRDRL